MARNVSDEELQLKKRARRRLVGAVVLVTAVAVVLPMILDSEPKPTNQDINIHIPSPDAAELPGKPLPLKPAARPPKAAENPETKAISKAEPEAVAKPAEKTEVKAETKAKAETKPKPITKPKPVKEAAPKPKPPAAKPEAKAAPSAPPKSAETFAVQVIALSDADRAKTLQAKIAGSGMKAYTEVVQTAGGPVTRVRVGPYESRDAAERARRKLLDMKFDSSKVVSLQ